MQKKLTILACAALLGAAATAQAAVVTFDNPGVITIDEGVATYLEAGFAIVGPAASFLTLDEVLVAGFDTTPFSLRTMGGALFGLQSLQYGVYDLGFGGPAGTLSVVGLLNGLQVAAQQFSLGALATANFGAPWAGLTEVRFSATGGFFLDNINANQNAVPEPGTWMLAGLGLAALAAGRVRRVRPRA